MIGRGHAARAGRALSRENRLTEILARVLVGLSIAMVAVPTIRLSGPGIDDSWIFGVTEAGATGMQFGDDIMFTYGPWAFLDTFAAIEPGPLVLGWIAWALTGAGIVVVAWFLLRRWLPRLPAAVLIVAVVAPVTAIANVQTGFSARVLVLAILLALGLVVGAIPARATLPLLLAAAVASAFAIESKFSNGVLALATLLLVAVLAVGPGIARRARTAGLVLGAALLTFVAAWPLSGQRLENLPGWIRGSLELTAGYADAMARYGDPGQYVVLAVALALVAVGLVLRARDTGWNWPLAIIVAWTLIVAVRLGFTRLDIIHVGTTMTLVLCVLLVLGVRRFAWAGIIAITVAGALVFALWGVRYVHVVNPVAWARQTVLLTSAIVSPEVRERLDAEGGQRARDGLPVEPEILSALRGKSVHIDPWDTVVAGAYGLDWHPVPVFQSYAAFTPALDELDADVLRSADGPDAVLRAAHGTIDKRNVMWESPAATLELVCSFEPGAFSERWLVLDRAARRCGERSDLGSTTFGAGETISVPSAPDDQSMVVASFEIDDPIWNKLARTLLKSPSPVWVVADGTPCRLPIALSGGPLILRLPQTAGWPAAFGGATDFDTLTLAQGGTVHFSVIRIG